MPLYEYLCDTCGEKFEVMQKFADQPLSTHDKCGGKVARLISAPALQFKGTGWYITDYAKGGSSSSGNSGKDEGGKSKNAENSKSEGSKSDGSKTESSKTNTSDKSAASTPAASSSSSEKK